MKRLIIVMTILAGLYLTASFYSQQPSCVRLFDFSNYAYPSYPTADDAGSSSSSSEDVIQLHDGVYRYPGEANPSIGVFFEKVLYGDLTGDGIEEAVVVLGDHGGGSNGYDCLVYVFQCVSGAPRLIYVEDYERAKSVTIRRHRLVVTAPMWTSDDPHCCPKYMATYEMKYSAHSRPVFAIVHRSLKPLANPKKN